MFAVLGDEADFCEWVSRLGGESTLAAAFCVAFVERAAPVEAAGRAVLVAAR